MKRSLDFASRSARVVALIGGAALLVAMATDAAAVLGRHIGIAVVGSIEVFQVSVGVAVSAAIVLTTLFDRHAAVHVLTDHMRSRPRRVIIRTGLVASALAFALLCAGSIWVAADLWASQEMTELVGIPLRWFRLIWIASTAAVAAIFLLRPVRPVQP